MQEPTLTRLAAIGGIVFVVLTNVGLFLAQWPDLDSSRDQVRTFLHTTSYSHAWAGGFLAILGSLGLVTFAALIATRLRAPLSQLALGGASVYAACIVTGSGLQVALTHRPGSTPLVAAILLVDAAPLIQLGSLASAALVTLAAGASASSPNGLLPRWCGWFGLITTATVIASIGLLAATTAAGHVAALIYEAWVFATSIMLWRSARASASPGTLRTQTASPT
jgi:hypothetical protein